MDLYAFLNPTKVENIEVIVSERFKGKDGKVVPFVIKPITQEESAALMKKHTKKDKKTGNETLDRTAFTSELVAISVVEPDLTNADLQSHYGVMGASALLQKMLFVGEFATLSEKVQEISGLDADINDDIEVAKN